MFFRVLCPLSVSCVTVGVFHFGVFQVPICVVKPGQIPKTRAQVDLMKSSGEEFILDPADLVDIHREGLPVVITDNGEGYFAATTHMSSIELTKSKVCSFRVRCPPKRVRCPIQ